MTAGLIAVGDAVAADDWRAAGAPAWLAALGGRAAALPLLCLVLLAPLLALRWGARLSFEVLQHACMPRLLLWWL